MKTFIELKNMRFFAYHGVLAQEKTIGNHFIVNVRFAADVSKAIETDDVNDTVNYALVYDMIKAEMIIPSDLIEHVAGRIFASIKKSFPQIEQLEVRVAKLNPPVNGEVESSEICLCE